MRFFHPLWFFILLLKVNQSAQQNGNTCPEPEILHGFHQTFSSIEYFCQDGYKLVGDSTNKCSTNGWANPHSVCEQITCDLGDTHPNLRVNPAPAENQPFIVGQTLRFTCTDDFTLVGSPNINCEKTGLWSNEVPTCSDRHHCTTPPPLLNGDTLEIPKPQYNNNERVEYTCARYYTMQGEPYMTCLNREWRGEMKCLRPCIVNKALMNERNIQFRYKSDDRLYASHGQSLTFMCKGWTYHDGQLPMRSVCNDGVIYLPRCE